jgi:hypothetical protein
MADEFSAGYASTFACSRTLCGRQIASIAGPEMS